jgi:PKD domain/FG-GAP-like repeat
MNTLNIKERVASQRKRCLTFTLWITTITLITLSVEGAAWAGFVDRSTNLLTSTFSFTGTFPAAGDSNENYYDGDMGDFDGDGWMDRALLARYGLLLNTGGGFMTPAANTIAGGTYRFGDKDGVGNDAAQWADVDNDGDLDIIQGGNGETLTLQINTGLGRFTTKPIPSVSALNIVNIDIDKDGDVDLAIAHAFCSDLQCGHGCPEEGCQGVGDWPKQFALLLNDGKGNFTEVTQARGFPNNFGTNLIVGLVAGDVDGDGDFDLMMINGIQRGITLARNTGTGSFTLSRIPFALAMAPIRPIQSGFNQGMNLGDIDGDGDLDLVCALDRDTTGSPHPRVAHAVFINDGAGNFVEETATRFTVEGTGFYSGGNGKLMDVDYDGDLDFFAFKGNAKHFQVYLNDGTGHFTYSTNDSRIFTGGSSTGTGADNDVTDLNRDGSYDVWIGAAGQDPRTLINTYQSADALPANLPRNFRVLAADTNGITLSWQHPPYADTVRWYKVYRSTAPDMAPTDRRVLKQVAISRHQDEGFAAPITSFTTTAYLNDPDVLLIGTNNEVQFTDRTALPGVTYYYTVAHVGTENIESVPTGELAANIAPTGGADTTPPSLEIVSPKMQDWSAYPRVVLDYADGGSGIDLSSLRVSFSPPLGSGGPGSAPEDQSFRRDETAFIAAMSPPLSLPSNTLITLTVSIADRAGNVSTQQVQFFVSVVAPILPSAVITMNTTNEATSLTVELEGSASRDTDGKIVRWEWYFGDGTTALGREVKKTYKKAGTYKATLLVRDTHGGASIARQAITLKEFPITDFRITDWKIDANGFSISFPTEINRTYTVEHTASLASPDWTDLSTLSGNGATRSLTHTNVSGTQKFYKVRVN